MSTRPLDTLPVGEVRTIAGYVARSLRHERRMAEAYRRDGERDSALWQPLANACRRAAAFEWASSKNAGAVRGLWGEAARVLTRGFTTRQTGFDPGADQFILALHLSIAAREREAFTRLAVMPSAARSAAMRSAAFRGARALLDLAEGYALAACALVERDARLVIPARELLASARRASERRWWEDQYVEPLEAAWRYKEHAAICSLLDLIAEQIADRGSIESTIERRAIEFASIVDETLAELQNFVERAVDHHPKLYVWLPGIALCRLAASADLPLGILREKAADGGYQRLPSELL